LLVSTFYSISLILSSLERPPSSVGDKILLSQDSASGKSLNRKTSIAALAAYSPIRADVDRELTKNLSMFWDYLFILFYFISFHFFSSYFIFPSFLFSCYLLFLFYLL
jgi:hypothetical protein